MRENGTYTKAVELRRKSGLVRGELLNVEEAAAYVHLGTTNLYDCAKKGLLPFFRPTIGKMQFDSADLDDWLRASKVPAGTLSGGI